MKLPSIVKQIGEAEGEIRVYIEDYVYSYLNELKKRKEVLPLRVVLFGHTCSRELQKFYFIYGAASVIDELEKGRREEHVREVFFPEYEIIGYVNVYGDKLELGGKKNGYYIFYDSNEPMQNYLLSCYEKETNTSKPVSKEEREALARVWQEPERRVHFSVGNLIKKMLYVICIILVAIAVTTINDYPKMYGFMETAERAILASSAR